MHQHLSGGHHTHHFCDEHRIHKASTRNEYEYEYEYESIRKNVEYQYECTDVQHQNSSGGLTKLTLFQRDLVVTQQQLWESVSSITVWKVHVQFLTV